MATTCERLSLLFKRHAIDPQLRRSSKKLRILANPFYCDKFCNVKYHNSVRQYAN